MSSEKITVSEDDFVKIKSFQVNLTQPRGSSRGSNRASPSGMRPSKCPAPLERHCDINTGGGKVSVLLLLFD